MNQAVFYEPVTVVRSGRGLTTEIPETCAAEDLGVEADPLEQFLRMEVSYQIIDFDRSRGGSPPVESSAEREPEFRKAGEGSVPVSGPNGLGLTGNELRATRFLLDFSNVFSRRRTPEVSPRFRGRSVQSELNVVPPISN